MGLIGPETDGSTAIDGIVAVGSGHANQNAMSAAAAANAAHGLARGPPTLAIASLSIRAAADITLQYRFPSLCSRSQLISGTVAPGAFLLYRPRIGLQSRFKRARCQVQTTGDPGGTRFLYRRNFRRSCAGIDDTCLRPGGHNERDPKARVDPGGGPRQLQPARRRRQRMANALPLSWAKITVADFGGTGVSLTAR